MEAIQSSISEAFERIEYTDSEGSESDDPLEMGSLEASNPFLNFSFMNLPNLHALSHETYVKNSPRLFEEAEEEEIRPLRATRGSHLRIMTSQYPESDSESLDDSEEGLKEEMPEGKFSL